MTALVAENKDRAGRPSQQHLYFPHQSFSAKLDLIFAYRLMAVQSPTKVHQFVEVLGLVESEPLDHIGGMAIRVALATFGAAFGYWRRFDLGIWKVDRWV